MNHQFWVRMVGLKERKQVGVHNVPFPKQHKCFTCNGIVTTQESHEVLQGLCSSQSHDWMFSGRTMSGELLLTIDTHRYFQCCFRSGSLWTFSNGLSFTFHRNREAVACKLVFTRMKMSMVVDKIEIMSQERLRSRHNVLNHVSQGLLALTFFNHTQSLFPYIITLAHQ